MTPCPLAVLVLPLVVLAAAAVVPAASPLLPLLDGGRVEQEPDRRISAVGFTQSIQKHTGVFPEPT